MTEDQKQIADDLIDMLRRRFFRDQARWPDDWDGVELRLLLRECADDFLPPRSRFAQRIAQFKNEWLIHNF